jgi:hypothetical protein
MSPGLSVTYGPQRPWTSQWLNVLQHLETVEAGCRPESYQGNAPLKLAIENFFIQCFHFGDWLWMDQTTGLTRDKVVDFIRRDSALRICEGIANTSKHHTRRRTSTMTAVVASVSYSESGVWAVIKWTEMPDSGKRDALDLARQCVAAWDGYLKSQGLDENADG